MNLKTEMRYSIIKDKMPCKIRNSNGDILTITHIARGVVDKDIVIVAIKELGGAYNLERLDIEEILEE